MNPKTILNVFKDKKVGGEYTRFGTLNKWLVMKILTRIGIEPCDPEVICFEPQISVLIQVIGKYLSRSHFRESLPVINLHAAIVSVVYNETAMR